MNNFINNNKYVLDKVRNRRNELLNKTDKYLLSDYPITLEQQMLIKTYRQELRQFINNNEIKILAGEKIELPTVPDFIWFKYNLLIII